MEILRDKIDTREIYITLLITFKNVLPCDTIKHIVLLSKDKSKAELTLRYKLKFKRRVCVSEYNPRYKESKSDSDIKPKSKPRNITFDKGIKRMCKFLAPGSNIISSGGIKTLNLFISTLIIKMTLKSIILAQHGRRITISSRDVQSCVMIVCSEKFARELVYEGTKAVTRYNAHVANKPSPRKKESKIPSKREYLVDMIGTRIEPRKVERIMRQYIRDKNVDEDMNIRMGIGAAIYLTAIVNKTVERIISFTNKSTSGNISTQSIINACKNDNELKYLYYELFI
jgi:histone H3/H4